MKQQNSLIKSLILSAKIGMMILVLLKFYLMFTNQEFSRLTVAIISPIIVFLPDILRYFKVKITKNMEIMYLIFIFVSFILGSIFHFYDIVPLFDKFAHTFSGVLTAFLATVLIKDLKLKAKNQTSFELFFINLFSLAVAGGWELYEYFAGIATGGDLQRVAETGVTDTMVDMTVAFTGSIIFTSFYYLTRKN